MKRVSFEALAELDTMCCGQSWRSTGVLSQSNYSLENRLTLFSNDKFLLLNHLKKEEHTLVQSSCLRKDKLVVLLYFSRLCFHETSRFFSCFFPCMIGK